jgi:hypothetical protein
LAFGGHAYAFCSGALSWNAAAADCVVKGMRLIRIDDAAENSWATIAFAGAGSTASQTWCWIGASDQAVLGEWRWSDGALFWLGSSNGTPQGGLYSHWVSGSPTNGGMATDCGILQNSVAGWWTDQDCSLAQPYMCEQY